MTNILVSIDPQKLQIEIIHNYLSNESYWAEGRSIETVKKSIENSLCFGIYENDQQIGFARVVTDYAVFGWIMDLFILPSHQGKGLGKILMERIMNCSELEEVKKWGLMTKDAHRLYKQYGFDNHPKPEMFMVKRE